MPWSTSSPGLRRSSIDFSVASMSVRVRSMSARISSGLLSPLVAISSAPCRVACMVPDELPVPAQRFHGALGLQVLRLHLLAAAVEGDVADDHHHQADD